MSTKLPLMSKLGVIFLTWRRSLQKDLLPHKITLKQQFVLKQLSKKDYLYPSQIADMLFCDRPTATVIIKNMEREKWIRREKDNENGKQIRIAITELGRNKIDLLEKSFELSESNEFDPLSCLSEDEKTQLDNVLTKVISYINTSPSK